jgi:hypothetical protein
VTNVDNVEVVMDSQVQEAVIGSIDDIVRECTGRTKATEQLSTIGARLRSTMNASAAGPALVAQEVVRLGNKWDDYRDEAGGADCTTWLKKHVTGSKGLAWFERLNAAVETVGRGHANRMESEATLWVGQSLAAAHRPTVLERVSKQYRKNNSSCVTIWQVRRLAAEFLSPRKAKVCVRCQQLEDAIVALGGVVPDR